MMKIRNPKSEIRSPDLSHAVGLNRMEAAVIRLALDQVILQNPGTREAHLAQHVKSKIGKWPY